MNKIESLVHNTLKGSPRLKTKVRNLYQSFFDLLPDSAGFSLNEIEVKEGYFFGFHDIKPFSSDDNYVLANKLTIPLRMPTQDDILEIGYFPFNKKTGDYRKIGISKAWNYHKGCRLQWLGKEKLIYNDAEHNTLVSRVYNIKGDLEKTIPCPIDSASSCGQLATTFSYGRLEKLMPGYGYCVEDKVESDADLNENTPHTTGLFLVHIDSGRKELLVSLHDLARMEPDFNALESTHFVTHSLFSADSRYISSLHRWIDNSGKRWTRLLVYDLKEKKCHFSPTNGMVSHYVWNRKNQIIAYCCIGSKDSHVLFEEPTLQKYKRVAYPELNFDGHHNFMSANEFVTDAYPTKRRMANLYKVEIDTNKVTQLASVKSFKKYQSIQGCHWSCDLHPRTNNKGDIVCFDSVHTGQRALCFMPI